MALTDQPYLPLYVDDWMNNNKLKSCSPGAHGLMVSIMCIMHKEEKYGTILLKQKFKQKDKQLHNFCLQLSKLTCFTEHQIEPYLSELIDEEVLILKDDKLICRRMIKDAGISNTRASAGSKGGKKTQENNKKPASQLALPKIEANTGIGNGIDNVNVNGIDKEGGVGEGEGKEGVEGSFKPVTFGNPIIPRMLIIFKKYNPDDPDNGDLDKAACQMICQIISKHEHWPKNSFTQENALAALAIFENAIKFSKTHNFFMQLPLQRLSKEFSGLLKAMKVNKISSNGTYSNQQSDKKPIIPATRSESDFEQP